MAKKSLTAASRNEPVKTPSQEAQLAFSRIALGDWSGIPANVLHELERFGYVSREIGYEVAHERPALGTVGFLGSAGEVVKHLVSDGVLRPRMAWKANPVALAAWGVFCELYGDPVPDMPARGRAQVGDRRRRQ